MPKNKLKVDISKLEKRYNVSKYSEDDWHLYVEKRTDSILKNHIMTPAGENLFLLNVGCGAYARGSSEWTEINLDLFTAPLMSKSYPVCADACHLPFRDNAFAAVVCVGEVLSYVDPVQVLREIGRIIIPSGTVIIDFGNSKSLRHLFLPTYGRRADLISVPYNGYPENTWVYQPEFIKEALRETGLSVKKTYGTHTWSCLALRCGIEERMALKIQNLLNWVPAPWSWAETITMVAEKCSPLR